MHIRHYLRYADDFAILDKDEKNLESKVPLINDFLEDRLKLKLHPQKIIINKFSQGIDFLGYVCFPHHRLIRTKTRRRMFKRLNKAMQELKDGKITDKTFNQTLQSYLGLLQHANTHTLAKEVKLRLKS